MFSFTPEQPSYSQSVPLYEEARAGDGWVGHTTGKSKAKLLNEVQENIRRLGGIITDMPFGHFDTGDDRQRAGYRIQFNIRVNGGAKIIRGEINVAALPVRFKGHEEAAIKMLLFMLRDAFRAAWFMQQLSPGYAALMPFLLVDGKRTVTQVWSEQPSISALLPDPSATFIEGEIVN